MLTAGRNYIIAKKLRAMSTDFRPLDGEKYCHHQTVITLQNSHYQIVKNPLETNS